MNKTNNPSFIPPIDPGLRHDYADKFIEDFKTYLSGIEKILDECGAGMKSKEFRAWYKHMLTIEMSVVTLSNYVQKHVDHHEYRLQVFDEFVERVNKDIS